MDRAQYLSAEEVHTLRVSTEHWALTDLRAGRLQGPKVWLLVDLALSTGLRVGEIALLTVGDVDFRRRALTVTRTKRRKHVQETLPMSEGLAAHLEAHIATQGRTEPSTPLLKGQNGRISRRALQNRWKSAMRRAGSLPPLSVHGARHSLATTLLHKTKNLRLVQLQLGHTSIVTTAKMYGHVSWEDRAQGVEDAYQQD